jgi:hypothetical protein
MATSSLLEELKRLAAGPQLGQKPLGAPAATPFPAAPVAPTVGPTLANAAAAAQPPAIDPGQAAPPVLDPNQEATFDFSGAIEKFPEDLGLTEQVRPTFDQPMISSTPDQGLKPFDQGGETLFVNPAGRRQLSGVNPPTDITPPSEQAPRGGITTQGGIPLAEFLGGGAIEGTQFTRPEATLGGRGDSGTAGAQALQDAGVAAGTRAGPGGTFAETRTGTARGPSSRDRAAGELSMADAVDLAGGDREKARALVVESRQPKVDTRTPEEVASDEAKAEGVRLENERKQQIIDQGNQPNATGFQKKQGEWEERKKDLEAEGMSEKEIAARRRAFLHGDTFDPFEFENTGGDVDSTEGSTSDAGSTPAASTPTEFTAGTQRKQGGKVYEFDGSKWNEVK